MSWRRSSRPCIAGLASVPLHAFAELVLRRCAELDKALSSGFNVNTQICILRVAKPERAQIVAHCVFMIGRMMHRRRATNASRAAATPARAYKLVAQRARL